MITLLEVEFEGSTVSIAIDDSHGETFLVADPIPLTEIRALEIAKGLIEWAKPRLPGYATLIQETIPK